MRAFVPDYQLISKASLQETLQALSVEPQKWKVFAGGTDLMVLFEAGKLQHKQFLNLSPFVELRKIEESSDELKIGALCTYTDLQKNKINQSEFPLIARSGWVTGAKAIQNRGTIGGNIANASPAADTPPSLLAYGAKIELLSEKGARIMDYSQFHLGYKKTQMQPDEIVSAILLPRHKKWTHHYYRKVGTRAFQSISKIAVSAAARVENQVVGEIHIGIASVAATPLRAFSLEKALQGQSISDILKGQSVSDFVRTLTPVDDIRSTADYRRIVLERVLNHLIEVLQLPPGAYLES